MGGRDCNINSNFDINSIHSLPQSWRVPRRWKSRNYSDEGGDCTHNSNDEDNYIHSLPSPLKVPRKRKSGRGFKGEGDCYDPIEGKIHSLHALNNNSQYKLETSNRFSPLMDNEEEQEDILHRYRNRDSSPERKRLRLVCFEDFGDFCKKNSKSILSQLYNNSICVTYNNKSNLCSGYFPDFISDPYVDSCIFNNINDGIFIDGPPDFVADFKQYYPFVSENKYLKQISNANSKYDNSYFRNLRFEHKICKKFWGPPKKGKSLRLISSININKPKTLPNCEGYDRIVMSSDIRTSKGGKQTLENQTLRNNQCSKNNQLSKTSYSSYAHIK